MPLHAQTKAAADVLLRIAQSVAREHVVRVPLNLPSSLYDRLYRHTNEKQSKTMSAFCRSAIVKELDRIEGNEKNESRDIARIITQFQDAFPGSHLTLPEAEWLLDKLEKIA